MPHDLEGILSRALAVADEVVGPAAEGVDRDAAWPEASLRALREAGLGGLLVPRRHGGLGQGMSALLWVCETLGRVCGSTALCYGMHSVGVACIAARATEEQAETLLGPIARGEHLTALSLSEPGTGGMLWLPEARMQRVDGGYRLDGTKAFVTSGGRADSYVTSTVCADVDAPPGHFSLVVVPEHAAGMSWGPAWEGWGMRGNGARPLTLDGVVVPRHHLLGGEGEQIWYLFHVVAPHFVAAMTGVYLGISQRALDEATAQIRVRVQAQTGRPLAHVVSVQIELGRLWARLEAVRSLAVAAAASADRSEPAALRALLAAKAEVARVSVDVANRCLTLGGGRAYAERGVLERCLRDARAAQVQAPVSELLYTWVGRTLLDVPLLGD